MTEHPSDLAVRWTHDALVCDARPYGRSVSFSSLKWIGPTVAVAWFASAPLAALLLAGGTSYVLWTWRGEQVRAEQTQQLRLTSTQLTIRRARNGREVHSRTLSLQAVGRVNARHTSSGFALVLQVAGEPNLEIPIQLESQQGGDWLARSIEKAASVARNAQGDVPGTVPESLKALLSTGG